MSHQNGDKINSTAYHTRGDRKEDGKVECVNDWTGVNKYVCEMQGGKNHNRPVVCEP